MQLKNLTKIEKIIVQFLILFIIGSFISYLIGNLLITFFTCFLVSMMFNWKKIEGYRKKMKTEQPTQQSYCQQCGSKLLSGSQFCHSCGSKMMTPSTSSSIASGEYYSPQDLWWTYKTIKENYNKGKIDSQIYSWFFSEIVLIDDKGIYWSIDADSLNWLQSQKGNWVPGQPLGNLRVIQTIDLYLM